MFKNLYHFLKEKNYLINTKQKKVLGYDFSYWSDSAIWVLLSIFLLVILFINNSGYHSCHAYCHTNYFKVIVDTITISIAVVFPIASFLSFTIRSLFGIKALIFKTIYSRQIKKTKEAVTDYFFSNPKELKKLINDSEKVEHFSRYIDDSLIFKNTFDKPSFHTHLHTYLNNYIIEVERLAMLEKIDLSDTGAIVSLMSEKLPVVPIEDKIHNKFLYQK